MRKIFILALSFILMSTTAFAATKHKTVYKTMKGSVKTVTLADSAKGTKSEVTVLDEKSAEKTFLVKSTTTLYGKDFKAIGLDKIMPDDKIKVKYATTKEGVHEAVTINILK
jgi:hypothetical protein